MTSNIVMTKNYDMVSAAVEEMASTSQQEPQPEAGRREHHEEKTERLRQNHHHHHQLVWLATSYVMSGAVHELFHILAAKALGYPIFLNDTVIPTLFGMLFGRTTILPSLGQAEELDVTLIRHAGWVGSLILYLSIYLIVSHTSNQYQPSQLSAPQNTFNSILENFRSAALVTLLEALTTDLLGLSVLGGKTMFCCGNFGVIILNNAWVQTPGDNGKTVLDLLEKMISITMMRGGTYFDMVPKKYLQPYSVDFDPLLLSHQRTLPSHCISQLIWNKSEQLKREASLLGRTNQGKHLIQ